MGKRYYNLYPQVIQPLNLWHAYKQAARGKRLQPTVAEFEYDLEYNLFDLECELRDGGYQPGGYRSFVIQSPKSRVISAAPFRDRVVHHALMNIIAPLFERQFIYDSYANRVGKGTHRALDRCTYYLRRNKYVIHCDVRQFFPSIDHHIMQSILARTIADQDVLGLIAKILSNGVQIDQESQTLDYFPGDDLFSPLRARGLPIGNLTSQHWANVYLNELDQYVKRRLKCRAYLRYVDDLLLFANRKEQLHIWRAEIIPFLKGLRLRLHEKRAQPRPVQTGVSFLGFIVFPDHRRLKRRNGVAFQRRLQKLADDWRRGDMSEEKLRASLQGWINHARYGDTWGLRQVVLAAAGLGYVGLLDG